MNYTYRPDLFYIKTESTNHSVREKIVTQFQWFWYRIQFWRFKKLKNFNVLEERWLRYDWNIQNKIEKKVWWHPIIDKYCRKKYNGYLC